jgi:hypothetical protein
MYHQISIKGLTILKKINLQTIMRYDYDRVEPQQHLRSDPNEINGVRVMYHRLSIKISNNTKKINLHICATIMTGLGRSHDVRVNFEFIYLKSII